MARNKSERSPSGDPMVDDYLRAWLRWRRHLRGHSMDPPSQLLVDMRLKKDLLSHEQFALMNRLDGVVSSLETKDVERLYGHEPEFQNGTQSK